MFLMYALIKKEKNKFFIIGLHILFNRFLKKATYGQQYKIFEFD